MACRRFSAFRELSLDFAFANLTPAVSVQYPAQLAVDLKVPLMVMVVMPVGVVDVKVAFAYGSGCQSSFGVS